MKTFSITAAAIAATSLAIFACSGGSDDTTSSSSSGGSSSGGSTSSSGSTTGASSSGGSSSGGSSSGGSSSGGGGTFSCESKSTCPNEPAPDADAKQNCEAVMASQCAAEFKALGQCSLDKGVCKSDGTYDKDATSDGPCKTEGDAFQACFLAGFDAGQ